MKYTLTRVRLRAISEFFGTTLYGERWTREPKKHRKNDPKRIRRHKRKAIERDGE